MIVQSGYECYFTQSGDVPAAERVFLTQMNIAGVEELSLWREITRTEMDQFLAKTAFIDVGNIDYDSLVRVNMLIKNITANINTAMLTPEQAINMSHYYPKWDRLVAVCTYQSDTPALLPVGYRLQHFGQLYEVIKEHVPQVDWVPGKGTESLYKVVQIAHTGTKENPIQWQHNMVLEIGKIYIDKGVLYECIRDSRIGMVYDLKDLVSGGYVKEVAGV